MEAHDEEALINSQLDDVREVTAAGPVSNRGDAFHNQFGIGHFAATAGEFSMLTSEDEQLIAEEVVMNMGRWLKHLEMAHVFSMPCKSVQRSTPSNFVRWRQELLSPMLMSNATGGRYVSQHANRGLRSAEKGHVYATACISASLQEK